MNDIPSSDQVRNLGNLSAPDDRNLLWARLRQETGQFETPTVEDFYNDLQDCELASSVPLEIRTHFETGKNLYLYSWFCYRLGMVCELHTYTTMELALKTKFEHEKLPKPNGLSGMLKSAFGYQWVSSEGFDDYRNKKGNMLRSLKADEEMFARIEQMNLNVDYERHEREFSDRYIEHLTRLIPGIRNELGHGSTMLMQPGIVLGTLYICRDLVNQLFPENRPTSNVGHTT